MDLNFKALLLAHNLSCLEDTGLLNSFIAIFERQKNKITEDVIDYLKKNKVMTTKDFQTLIDKHLIRLRKIRNGSREVIVTKKSLAKKKKK